MNEKVNVYWAPPHEVPALRNTKDNMVTNNLVKTRLILDKILDNINSDDTVAVKIHVGEAYNTRYLRHDYVREVVNAIKSKGGIPSLIETQGIGNNINKIDISDGYHVCLGHRKNEKDHMKIAQLHGYSESIIGAPLKFVDGRDGLHYKKINVDGIQFKDVAVAAGLFDFDKMVVISRFKGHAQCAFGGALKQLGIGCVSKISKWLAHFDGSPTVNKRRCDLSKCKQECMAACPLNSIEILEGKANIDDFKCMGCFYCIRKCPVKRALKKPLINEGEDFVKKVADNAAAVTQSFGPENIRYINFATEITFQCDCVSNIGMPVVPDLGIFGSADPLAIDKACVDAETEAPGLSFRNVKGEWVDPVVRGVEKFRALGALGEASWIIEAALKNKIGTTDYELINIFS